MAYLPFPTRTRRVSRAPVWPAGAMLVMIAVGAQALAADDRDTRRERTSPGLMLDPGGRQGACDALLFTPDGAKLIAAGDDKVVRVWPVSDDGREVGQARLLRWPIGRDQRGAIYAAGLVPGADGQEPRYLAVGGHGSRTAAVSLLDLRTGDARYLNPAEGGLPQIALWAVAAAPNGRELVVGNGQGSVYRWALGDGPAPVAQCFGSPLPPSAPRNQVRFLAYRPDGRTVIAVAEDGVVREWTAARPTRRPAELAVLPIHPSRAFRVTASPALDVLACCVAETDRASGLAADRVALLSLTGGGVNTTIRLPPLPKDLKAAAGHRERAHSLAFSGDGRYLAVGTMIVWLGRAPDAADFFYDVGGRIHVYDLADPARPKRLGSSPVENNRIERLAFHPRHNNVLAAAGGDDHAVKLWDWPSWLVKAAMVGSGRSIWDVGLSTDGKRLGVRFDREGRPEHATKWGRGAWQVLDIEAGAVAGDPPDFRPTRPVLAYEKWRVEPTADPSVWQVVSPAGRKTPLTGTGLYDLAVNGVPRCYTFVPAATATTPRLAVGHSHGVSVYDLIGGKPVLARVLAGHEGAVTCVAPSADGQALVTGSRDMTVGGWSLADWPSQRELGARFEGRDGRLVVAEVDAGSPAWEVGLTAGDEVLCVVISRAGHFFLHHDHRKAAFIDRYKLVNVPDANKTLEQTLDELAAPAPQREIFFVWRRPGEGRRDFPFAATAVRQRPLWRYFPTPAGDYLLWLWRDFRYDTNNVEFARRAAGWQVDSATFDTPAYYRLDQYPSRFQPAVVRRRVLDAIREPDLKSFSEVEPPAVELKVAEPDPKGDLVLSVTANARHKVLGPDDNQGLRRVEVYVNQSLLWSAQLGGRQEASFPKIQLPRDRLQEGKNRVVAYVYNHGDARGQAEYRCEVERHKGQRVPRKLHVLCVGVADYSRTNLWDLPAVATDLERLHRLFQDEKARGTLYEDVRVHPPLRDKAATATRVLDKLHSEAEATRDPNDLFVLCLLGHGAAGRQTDEDWYLVCHDGSRLTGSALTAALERLRCRKVIILESCQSGRLVNRPVVSAERSAQAALTRNTDMFIIAACRADQFAHAIEYKKSKEHRGLFTDSFVEAPYRTPTARSDRLTSTELQAYLKMDLAERVKSINLKTDEFVAQDPQFYREAAEPFDFLTRFKGPAGRGR